MGVCYCANISGVKYYVLQRVKILWPFFGANKTLANVLKSVASDFTWLSTESSFMHGIITVDE